MKRTYFATRYRLNNRDHYVIWFTSDKDDSDGVVISNGFIPIFNSKVELEKYAKANGFTPVDVSEPGLHNLDDLARWLKMKKMKRARQVDCVEFLNAWNLFTDVSKSINGNFDPNQERTQKIYYKLFWGSNLPSMTPKGRFYVPLWSGRELEIIHEVLKQGLLMFRNHTKHP